MKTIVDLHYCSKYLFADDQILSIESDCIKVGSPFDLDFIICDLNSENSVLIENVTEPEEWSCCKYKYINGEWSISPTWVDPRLE